MKVAAGLVLTEAAACFVAGIAFALAAVFGHPADRTTAIELGLLLTVYGVGVGLVARGIWRNRRWARTPSYLVQFFALVIAWYQRHTLLAVSVIVALVGFGTAYALSRLPAPDQ